jgi:hypothetical protein
LYGRFDTDFVFSLGAGAGIDAALRPTYTAELRARYLDSAGMVVAPQWQPDGEAAVALLVEARPLFLARFLGNSYSGRRWTDLTIDSIGIELGASLGPLKAGLGAALAAGGGIDFPLKTGERSARGLWLRIGARYVHASKSWIDGPNRGRDELLVLACLYYRFGADAALAGWEPTG